MIDNTKNTQISVFDIKIKRIFVANNVLLNNTLMKNLRTEILVIKRVRAKFALTVVQSVGVPVHSSILTR